MPPFSKDHEADRLLVEQIRAGDAEAWNDLIERYEGRLLAFVRQRLGDRTAAEDVVQEAFIGMLTALPNYDTRRSLENWLFSIASHKLIDHLRREGRRPALPLSGSSGNDRDSAPGSEPEGPARTASTMLRSHERRRLEEDAVARAIRELLARWREGENWDKLRCVELIFPCGTANKDVAVELGMTQQAVARVKFEFLAKLRAKLRDMDLPPDIFPEIYEEESA